MSSSLPSGGFNVDNSMPPAYTEKQRPKSNLILTPEQIVERDLELAGKDFENDLKYQLKPIEIRHEDWEWKIGILVISSTFIFVCFSPYLIIPNFSIIDNPLAFLFGILSSALFLVCLFFTVFKIPLDSIGNTEGDWYG